MEKKVFALAVPKKTNLESKARRVSFINKLRKNINRFTNKPIVFTKEGIWTYIIGIECNLIENLACVRTLSCVLSICQYRKNPKISDTQKFGVIILKVEQDGFSLE